MQGDDHIGLKRVGEDRRLKTEDNHNPQCSEREKETVKRGTLADFEYLTYGRGGARGSYKLVGRGFDSRWCHCNLSLT